jgi:hypothetical protein
VTIQKTPIIVECSVVFAPRGGLLPDAGTASSLLKAPLANKVDCPDCAAGSVSGHDPAVRENRLQ